MSHVFSDICIEEVNLFSQVAGSLTISSDDMNFEHVLSKYAMTPIDMQLFNTEVSESVPEELEQSAASALEVSEMSGVYEVIPEVIPEEQVECAKKNN